MRRVADSARERSVGVVALHQHRRLPTAIGPAPPLPLPCPALPPAAWCCCVSLPPPSSPPSTTLSPVTPATATPPGAFRRQDLGPGVKSRAASCNPPCMLQHDWGWHLQGGSRVVPSGLLSSSAARPAARPLTGHLPLLLRPRPAHPVPPQIGGIRLAFDPSRPDKYNRLLDARLSDLPGSPSLLTYTGDILLLTSNFVAAGGDK